jgi:hypothetical protein
MVIGKLEIEIDKNKREISFLEDKLKIGKDDFEKLVKSHKLEIEHFQKK